MSDILIPAIGVPVFLVGTYVLYKLFTWGAEDAVKKHLGGHR